MGSGDYHMALGMAGAYAASLPGGVSQGYKNSVASWAARAALEVNGKIGFVHGTIEHPFHGRKSDRGYQSRWQIFLDTGFDPATDLKRNTTGVLEFAGNKPALRARVRPLPARPRGGREHADLAGATPPQRRQAREERAPPLRSGPSGDCAATAWRRATMSFGEALARARAALSPKLHVNQRPGASAAVKGALFARRRSRAKPLDGEHAAGTRARKFSTTDIM